MRYEMKRNQEDLGKHLKDLSERMTHIEENHGSPMTRRARNQNRWTALNDRLGNVEQLVTVSF